MAWKRFCLFATPCMALWLLNGCASGQKTAAEPRIVETGSLAEAKLGIDGRPPAESIAMPITQLEREDVVKAVDAGLGQFLQKVDMEASVSETGSFAGFRILSFREPQAFHGLGIGPGDIITSINQHPIERPMEAYEAFVSLKTADNLEVDYLRGGRAMRLSLPIVGRAAQSDQKSKTAPADSTKKPEEEGE